MSTLVFSGVSKHFGEKSVLEGLSFTVDKGEIYGLLGPNGCGKSTAINILCGLLDPDSGSVRVGDGDSRCATSIIGVCPQEIALYRDLDAEENLLFFARLYGISRSDRRARVTSLMRLFGLQAIAGMRVAHLSGGWQRRVNIAAALVHSPEILVLDEPTSAVDLEARHDLWRIIEMLRQEGITLLLTTHHLDEAERLCSRVGIMKGRAIQQEGTIAELLALVPATSIALIETSDEAGVMERAVHIGWGIRHYAGKLACLLPHAVPLSDVVQALRGLEISAVNVQRVSLEHAYLEVTSSEAV